MTPSLTAVDFTSPSLAGSGPAYELKFLLDEAPAGRVEGWARDRMTLDPHGEPALGGAYRTTSLYFDTPTLDVYHRTGGHRLHKFRVRRYGSTPLAFLERKSKDDVRVRKQRTPVPLDDVRLLALPASLTDWPGGWFQRGLRSHRLFPACRVAYQRTAFAAKCDGAPLRLTLDRRLCGSPADGWELVPSVDALPLLPGRAILELKFRGALPALFAGLVSDMGLTLDTVSKYRLCRDAWGAPAAVGVVVSV